MSRLGTLDSNSEVSTFKYELLPNGSTAIKFDVNTTVKVTPTIAATYTTAVPPAGTRCNLVILTSGTTSRVITFGAGFKSLGTLTTGILASRVFVINFVSDGVSLYEAGRTAAITV